MRTWVNKDSTVLVQMWTDGTITVATRQHPSHTWGPPVYLKEQT